MSEAREAGLYWVRIGKTWLVSAPPIEEQKTMNGVTIVNGRYESFNFTPEDVDEWGERIPEPDSSPA